MEICIGEERALEDQEREEEGKRKGCHQRLDSGETLSHSDWRNILLDLDEMRWRESPAPA